MKLPCNNVTQICLPMESTKHMVKVSNNVCMEVHERVSVLDLWERVTKKDLLQER